jgi:hypothetical protein
MQRNVSGHASRSKPYKGIGMEGRLASWYAKNTAKDIAEFQQLAGHLDL